MHYDNLSSTKIEQVESDDHSPAECNSTSFLSFAKNSCMSVFNSRHTEVHQDQRSINTSSELWLKWLAEFKREETNKERQQRRLSL